MCALDYTKGESLSLRGHPEFSEAWLRDRIVEDPTILGIGDVEVRDVERIQPRAGRLDLLLRDPDTGKRYEVEIQTGATDESHIIRCIEYWDIERKRYPQFDHCAVLVAEDITARFLNVVSLFNGLIPLVAIKLSALRVGNNVVLNFVKVLDEVVLGEPDELADAPPPADRAYWEAKASRDSLLLVDGMFEVLRSVVPAVGIKYNKYYIGLTEGGRPNNFVIFRPKREHARIEVKVPDLDTWATALDDAGLTVLLGGRSEGRLTLRLARKDLEQHGDLLRQLFEASYKAQAT